MHPKVHRNTQAQVCKLPQNNALQWKVTKPISILIDLLLIDLPVSGGRVTELVGQLPNCTFCRFSGGQSSAISNREDSTATAADQFPASLHPLKPLKSAAQVAPMSTTALLHHQQSPLCIFSRWPDVNNAAYCVSIHTASALDDVSTIWRQVWPFAWNIHT